jgi:hypothetical protein
MEMNLDPDFKSTLKLNWQIVAWLGHIPSNVFFKEDGTSEIGLVGLPVADTFMVHYRRLQLCKTTNDQDFSKKMLPSINKRVSITQGLGIQQQ